MKDLRRISAPVRSEPISGKAIDTRALQVTAALENLSKAVETIREMVGRLNSRLSGTVARASVEPAASQAVKEAGRPVSVLVASNIEQATDDLVETNRMIMDLIERLEV